jgi:hypothetical protein
MDGVSGWFSPKASHLSQIGQAVPLRVVSAQFRAISVRGDIHHSG